MLLARVLSKSARRLWRTRVYNTKKALYVTSDVSRGYWFMKNTFVYYMNCALHIDEFKNSDHVYSLFKSNEKNMCAKCIRLF